MAILTELIQTGLGVEGQLQALYTHMVSIAQKGGKIQREPCQSQHRTNHNTRTVEARTVVLEKEKKDLLARLERKRKALEHKPPATVQAKMEWMDLERGLRQDLNATRNTLNST